MRIQVSNVQTSDSVELSGHQGPILGLSLDPEEQYVVSCARNFFYIKILSISLIII